MVEANALRGGTEEYVQRRRNELEREKSQPNHTSPVFGHAEADAKELTDNGVQGDGEFRFMAAATPTATATATATVETLTAPAAAVPAVPTAASGATQSSGKILSSKKSLSSFFQVIVAFYMHLFKPPKRNLHCNPLLP